MNLSQPLFADLISFARERLLFLEMFMFTTYNLVERWCQMVNSLIIMAQWHLVWYLLATVDLLVMPL